MQLKLFSPSEMGEIGLDFITKRLEISKRDLFKFSFVTYENFEDYLKFNDKTLSTEEKMSGEDLLKNVNKYFNSFERDFDISKFIIMYKTINSILPKLGGINKSSIDYWSSRNNISEFNFVQYKLLKKYVLSLERMVSNS